MVGVLVADDVTVVVGVVLVVGVVVKVVVAVVLSHNVLVSETAVAKMAACCAVTEPTVAGSEANASKIGPLTSFPMPCAQTVKAGFS